MPNISLKKVKELIEAGESSMVEFKRKILHPDKIAKEIVAFANSKGGYLIVGVDDNGEIYGIDSEKYEIEAINNCCNFLIDPPITPEIDIKYFGKKYIVVCYIKESEIKPHYLIKIENEQRRLQAYIRVGEKSIPASKEMTKILAGQGKFSKPITIYIGDKEKRYFEFLEKNERGSVNDFAKLVNISKQRARRIIVNLVRADVLAIHCDNGGDYYTLK